MIRTHTMEKRCHLRELVYWTVYHPYLVSLLFVIPPYLRIRMSCYVFLLLLYFLSTRWWM